MADSDLSLSILYFIRIKAKTQASLERESGFFAWPRPRQEQRTWGIGWAYPPCRHRPSAAEQHCRNARPHSKGKNSVPYDTLFSLKASSLFFAPFPARDVLHVSSALTSGKTRKFLAELSLGLELSWKGRGGTILDEPPVLRAFAFAKQRRANAPLDGSPALSLCFFLFTAGPRRFPGQPGPPQRPRSCPRAYQRPWA